MNWLIQFWLWLWNAVSSLWTPAKPAQVRFEHVEDLPDRPKASTLYIAGEGANAWAAAMLCPCGCGEVIRLNLLREVRPRWDVREHADGAVSLEPSVWRQKGCKSHFILRRGMIIWCEPTR